MKVLISADMEGATGITSAEEVNVGGPEWREARRLLTGDVNAAVAGLIEAGATTVIVNEAHASCRNLILSELHRGATVIRGRPKQYGMMEGVQSGVDAVAFVGYHGAAGGPGILSHTYYHRPIVQVLLNHQPTGEGKLNALLAAEFAVPVVLVTGDSVACTEASAYAGAARTVAVKQSSGRYSGQCMSPAASALAIEEAAKAGLVARQSPEAPSGPFTIEVEFTVAGCAEVVTAIPGVEAVSDRRARFTLPTVKETYRCLRAVAILAANSVETE